MTININVLLSVLNFLLTNVVAGAPKSLFFACFPIGHFHLNWILYYAVFFKVNRYFAPWRSFGIFGFCGLQENTAAPDLAKLFG